MDNGNYSKASIFIYIYIYIHSIPLLVGGGLTQGSRVQDLKLSCYLGCKAHDER